MAKRSTRTKQSNRTRPRGFAPWKPQSKTLAVVTEVQKVLLEYRAHLPLTVRQIYYRLVATRGYAKTEPAYKKLCDYMNRARRAGLIDFAHIRDDKASRYDPPAWSSTAEFLESVVAEARRFRLDRQAGQPVRLWVACEAQGMGPMLNRVADGYGVPVLTSGGFDSVTVKHDLAHELGESLRQGQRVELLHVGDFDPSGVHVFSSLADDVITFCMELVGTPPDFTRLAVTPEQVARYDLPTAPAKKTDKRKFDGDGTVQCESLPPDVLSQILRKAIETRRDGAIAEAVLAAEVRHRAELVQMLEGLDV